MPSNVTTDAVRSYHTLSPLPATLNASIDGSLGGLLSAALSVGSRPPTPEKTEADISSDSLANSGTDGITCSLMHG